MANTARRHLVDVGLWSVLFDGKLLVERSRDPECDAARALLALGHSGKLTMCDRDGRYLCMVDIERAAKVTARKRGVRPTSQSTLRHHLGKRPAPESHR